MTSCCSPDGRGPIAATSCPRCGQPGRTVERITLKALLKPGALPRLSLEQNRFCPTPDCGVVYYAPETIFVCDDLSVPVFQKEPQGERTVCYCFEVKETELRSELADAGVSSSASRVATLVKANRCACEVRNPQGSCCLGNIVSLVKSLEAELTSAR
jgi:hypothetical protein